MSKSEGKKIAIKFTHPINPLVVNPVVVVDAAFSSPSGYAIASGQYGSYAPMLAFDGGTNTYWRPSIITSQWIQIELLSPKSIVGFQMYTGTSYRPNGIDLYGSTNGVDFDLIIQTTNANSSGWKIHEFLKTMEYKYYRWDVTSIHSSRIYIYELQLKFAKIEYKTGNENAFIISGQQYLYTDGPNNNGALIDKIYEVKTVSTHPTTIDSILLEFDDAYCFRNAVGYININYNQALGNLSGQGGAITNFTETFVPLELTEEGNPMVREYVVGGVGGSISFIIIAKITTAPISEFIGASVHGSIQFIHIDDVNP